MNWTMRDLMIAAPLAILATMLSWALAIDKPFSREPDEIAIGMLLVGQGMLDLITFGVYTVRTTLWPDDR